MSYIMVDIEADGPIPGDYSMVSFGAVVVSPVSPVSSTANCGQFLTSSCQRRWRSVASVARKR